MEEEENIEAKKNYVEEVKPGIYVKKFKSGWRVVKPNMINGKICWKNLLIGGDWGNVIFIIIAICLLFVAQAYKHDTKECREFIRTIDSDCFFNCYEPCRNHIQINESLIKEKYGEGLAEGFAS